MASAFSNNTEKLNSSDRTSNYKAKTNYNYLRLVSLKNIKCKNKKFSSSSGNVILGLTNSVSQSNSSDPDNTTLSKLVNTSSYDLLNSINKGYYLPTTIPRNDTTNNNINRPPYTYDPSCNVFDDTKDEFVINYTIPNTSGDLQEILFNEYLDFGNLTLITNTQYIKDNDENNPPFKTMNSNQLQVTDASFTDYIIDPDNIISNYKDSGLPTYIGLQNEKSIYNSGDKEQVLKVINWKKILPNSFPNNKYHRFSFTEPIKFYNYNACLNNAVPPPDFNNDNIRFNDGNGFLWEPGKDSDSNPSGNIQEGVPDGTIIL